MTIPVENARASPQIVDEGDLFAWAKVAVPHATAPSQDSGWCTIPGTEFRVWRNADPVFAQPMLPTDTQLLLSFPPVEPARMIPRRLSAFMNADIRTVLVGNFRQRAAAAYLARHDIHYLGDLALMSSFDLLTRLGPHASSFKDIQDALLSLGLAIQSIAPWWTRPTDYYSRAR